MDDEDSENEDDDEDEDEDEDENASMNDLLLDGAYNEEDYSNLCVSDEVKYIFKYISRYRPVHPSLDTRFKPFIQDYIPAVGDIDAFIKLPRPDGNEELLGKTNLDEPAAQVTNYIALNYVLGCVICVKMLKNYDYC